MIKDMKTYLALLMTFKNEPHRRLHLCIIFFLTYSPIHFSYGAKKTPPKSPATVASGQDKLIITGKMIAKNEHLLAIKAKDGKVIKLPISALNKKQTSLKKGDTLTVEVDFESYEKLNKKK